MLTKTKTMEKYYGETLDYWKTNAEEDYVKTPISVLKYITVLEEALQQVKSGDLADVVESLFEPIDELPENRPLYKDSGLWQIRTDDMETVLYQQDVNETFDEFIKRCHAKESIWTNIDI